MDKKTKILILCTGNSCRSQMAEGFLRDRDERLEVHSAGTSPSEKVHPKAITAMKEVGLDISSHHPESVEKYLGRSFDYVITVCGGAKESCPAFTGDVRHRIHIGFDDPAEATGSEEEVMNVFRRVRDEIIRDFSRFYEEQLKKQP
jgi:arsenate reductase (thioredoxin)